MSWVREGVDGATIYTTLPDDHHIVEDGEDDNLGIIEGSSSYNRTNKNGRVYAKPWSEWDNGKIKILQWNEDCQLLGPNEPKLMFHLENLTRNGVMFPFTMVSWMVASNTSLDGVWKSAKIDNGEDHEMVYEERVFAEMQKLKLSYFGDQSLEIPTLIPVVPTYQGVQCLRCLRILTVVKVEETNVGDGVTTGQFYRYLAQDWILKSSLLHVHQLSDGGSYRGGNSCSREGPSSKVKKKKSLFDIRRKKRANSRTENVQKSQEMRLMTGVGGNRKRGANGER
ncbi:hypothetical protein GIB67_024436 [Kingdonia uniflora]|uniref:Uncharacterized protein n=1 Tax=Kingdonia uniflora TaxID=39325 RepID=A0A7J7P5K9_9MAGN|nr:hypothetical protein GIB67_024436 [Kingdonia uniflora]